MTAYRWALWTGILCCALDAHALDAEAIVARNREAVVTLYAARNGEPHAVQGSGCCVALSGLVLTAAHAVRGAEGVLARFEDGSERPLRLLVSDNAQDLALLQTEQPVKAAVALGDATALRAGSPIVAVSAPKGLYTSVATGIVASTDRVYNGRPMLQTDLSLNEGASGGAVFDRYGKLIGLIAARLDAVDSGVLVRPINQAFGLLRRHGVAVPEPGLPAPFETIPASADASDVERDAIEAYNRGVAAFAPEEKVVAYEEAVELRPEFFEAWFNLGVARTALEREDAAVEAYTRARALRPDSVAVLRNLGRLLLRQQRLDEVLGCFEAAVKAAPDDPGVRNDLGEAYRRLGRLEEARKSFQKALQLRSDYASARYNLGLTCMSLERWREAYASFRSYLILNPGAEDTDKVREWMAQLQEKMRK